MLVYLFEGCEKGGRQEGASHYENEFGERKTLRRRVDDAGGS